MKKNKYIALGYRIFCFVFTLIGLLTHMGLGSGKLNLKTLMYYTIQSNLLALILFGVLIYKTIVDIRKNGKIGDAGYSPRFEMVCVIDVLLTLIVYWALLAPGEFAMDTNYGMWSFKNLSVHLFVPFMCLIDYLVFTKPGHLKYRDVYYVIIYPLFYVVLSTCAGLLGYVYRVSSVDGQNVRFPYFFLDWDQTGAKVILYVIGLIGFFLILSHIMYWTDKKRAKKLL